MRMATGRGLAMTGAVVLACLLCGVAAGRGGPEGSPPPDAPGARESEGRLLVLNKGDDTLMVFDVPSHALLATIPVGAEPHEVAVTPDGRKAYVANVRGRSVSVVDLQRHKVIATLRPDHADYPHGMAITPDGRRLVLTSEGSHRLYVIDTRRDVVERSVTTTQAGSHMVVLAREGKRAWVANRGSDSISLFEMPGLRLMKTLKVGPGPEGIDVSPNGRWVVTALQNAGQVAVIDASTVQVITRLPAGQVPIRVAFLPRAPVALITNRGSDDVTVLDLAARQVMSTVQVGRRPGGLVTNARSTRAYVCNNESNTVSIVSLPGYEVTGTIKVGSNPDGIAFAPAPVPPPPRRAKPSGKSRG